MRKSSHIGADKMIGNEGDVGKARAQPNEDVI